MLRFFLFGQLDRSLVEKTFPLSPLSSLCGKCCSGDEQVDGIGFVCSLCTLFEGEREDSGVVTQPPVVGFVTCQSGTVNSGLLACTETNDGTVQSVADGVGLSVLESEGSDDQVGDGGLG